MIVTAVAVVSTVPYLVVGIIFPILFVAALFMLDQKVQISMKASARDTAYVGEEVKLEANIVVSKGFGLVMLHLPSSDEFDLIDGTNVHVIFKGFGVEERHYEYRLKALRRGVFSFNEATYSYYPSMGLLNKTEEKIPLGLEVKVLPRINALARSRMRLKSLHAIPTQSSSRLGPYSNEFISIRDYTVGDPYKFINWKASSRLANQDKLLVNDYEREGLRTFIFILDRGRLMTQGTGEENPLEFGIAYILSYSKLLLDEGINVGLWTIPGDQSGRHHIMPSSGAEHYHRLRELLIAAEPDTESIQSNVPDHSLVRIVRETKPVLIFVTNISRENIVRISQFANDLLRLRSSMTLVDIMPYTIIAKYGRGGESSLKNLYLATKMKKQYTMLPRGVRVIPWDPAEEKVGKPIRMSLALAKRTGARRH